MKNIQFDVFLKLTDYKDNLSPHIKIMVSFSIRDKCRERYLDELIDVWSMKRRVESQMKNKYEKR